MAVRAPAHSMVGGDHPKERPARKECPETPSILFSLRLRLAFESLDFFAQLFHGFDKNGNKLFISETLA